MSKFKFTQSALKDLEREDGCPSKWKQMWLDRAFRMESNVHMNKGKYFEYLAIGAGAIHGEDVTELPTTKAGAKTAETLRIELQAERCMRMLSDPTDPEYQGWTIISVQRKLKGKEEEGTLDVEVVNGAGEHAIIDLKLTGDVNGTRSQYGWGFSDLPTYDYTQQILYRKLYKEETGITPKMFVWVYDYSTNMLCKIIEVDITDGAEDAIGFRFEQARDVVSHYEANIWSTLPSGDECDTCKHVCEARQKKETLIKYTVQL